MTLYAQDGGGRVAFLIRNWSFYQNQMSLSMSKSCFFSRRGATQVSQSHGITTSAPLKNNNKKNKTKKIIFFFVEIIYTLHRFSQLDATRDDRSSKQTRPHTHEH